MTKFYVLVVGPHGVIEDRQVYAPSEKEAKDAVASDLAVGWAVREVFLSREEILKALNRR
jgi:hypothetical protein